MEAWAIANKILLFQDNTKTEVPFVKENVRAKKCDIREVEIETNNCFERRLQR